MRSLSFSASLKSLLAANVALCGLLGDMPEDKLDLLKLASRITAGDAQDLRRSCGARRGMSMLAAVFVTTCRTVFCEMPCPHSFPARQTLRKHPIYCHAERAAKRACPLTAETQHHHSTAEQFW